jgi:undecaprenyl-diphosphatase
MPMHGFRHWSAGRLLALASGLFIITITGSAAAQAPAQAPAVATDANLRITVPQAAVLGVIEGLTEYLPVSSTGHLILAGHAMGLTRFARDGDSGAKLARSPAIDAFDLVIQLGAILAVLGLYRRRVGQMCLGLAGRDRQGLRLAGLLLVAFLPAALVGKFFHEAIEARLFAPMPVILAMAVGGALMIVVEYFFWIRRDRSRRPATPVEGMLFSQAVFIGLAQCLAMWPGTSRSMITILAGLVVGLDMVAAAEFSFLLALPTLGAATLYSAYKQWHELMQAAGPLGLAVGLIVSGVVAALAVKAFVKWLTRHGMIPFGIYRIVAAGALYAYFRA